MGSSILRSILKASFRNMSTKLLIIALVLLVHQGNAHETSSEESGEVAERRFGSLGFLYKFFPEMENARNWTAAESTCQSLGGHLASVHSQQEMDFIVSNMGGSASVFFLGGKQEDENWEWTDGSGWERTFWLEGHPLDGTNLMGFQAGRWRSGTSIVDG